MRILRSHAHAAQPWLFAALNTAKRLPHATASRYRHHPIRSFSILGHLGMEVRSNRKRRKPVRSLPLRRKIMDGFGRPRHKGKPPEETPGLSRMDCASLRDEEGIS